MLQAINDRIKGWLGILVVVLIGLPFALWGIQSYFDDSGPRYAAKVNGVEISGAEFEYAVSAQKQRFLKQFNGKLPIEESVLRKQVLDQLINQRLLEVVTFDEGYRISDSVLGASIKQQFTVDGVFDRARLDATLAMKGESSQQYEREMRSDLRNRQAQVALAGSVVLGKNNVTRLAAIEQQQREVAIVTFSVDQFVGNYQPTATDIQDYYEKNQQRFMVPEKVKVDYVELTTDDIASGISIDEDKVLAKYDEYVASVSDREERRASHILIKVGSDSKDLAAAKTKLAMIKGKLDAGTPFAELAKEYSQDPGSSENGGDLNWVAAGDMVKPFEDALFSMNKGEVSDVVKTQFGLHLIKLVDIRSEPIEPLAVKRHEIENELKEEAAADQFYDLSENLANKAYENPDNLDAITESMDVKLQTTDYFSQQKGTGIAANEKVRKIAFSSDILEQGLNSDVIEISPKDIVVIRLNEHLDAIPIPLEQVQSQIITSLKAQSGFQKTLDTALAAKAELESGASLKSIATTGVTVAEPILLTRKDFAKVSDPSIINAAFDMVAPKKGETVVKEVTLSTGDVALLVLTKVVTPEVIAEDKKAPIKQALMQQVAVDEFSAVLSAIKAKADIEINNRILKAN